MSDHPLRALLEDAARGRFPPGDGSVRVVPSPPGRSDAVVAFTAHHIVAADVEPRDVMARLPDGDLGAPMSAPFLYWLGRRIGAEPGMVDAVLAAPGLAGPPDLDLRPARGVTHDRVSRAERYRDDVSVYVDPDDLAVVALGRGLARRLEMSVEVDETARARGLGRRVVRAARSLVPPDEFIFAQVSPGNAASLRAFLAAGFTPIGGEVLFLPG
jgi:GNAT superfamily N-acetyltransferase